MLFVKNHQSYIHFFFGFIVLSKYLVNSVNIDLYQQ